MLSGKNLSYRQTRVRLPLPYKGFGLSGTVDARKSSQDGANSVPRRV